MAIKKIINGEEHWQNRNGKFIPIKNIQKHMRRKDKVVTGIIARVIPLRERLQKEKLNIIADINNYLGWHQRVILKDAGIKDKDHDFTDGNVILSDFANTIKVELKINETMEFDEGLKTAEKLWKNCIKRGLKDVPSWMRVVVEDTFSVNKKGKINTQQVLRLTKYAVDDKEWKEATNIALRSIQVAGTKQYLNMKVRRDKNSNWESVGLNFSSL